MTEGVREEAEGRARVALLLSTKGHSSPPSGLLCLTFLPLAFKRCSLLSPFIALDAALSLGVSLHLCK